MKKLPTLSDGKMKRPKFIRFAAIDPWDNQMLCMVTFVYDCRDSARGIYGGARRRMIPAAKAGCPHILQGREPLVRARLIY